MISIIIASIGNLLPGGYNRKVLELEKRAGRFLEVTADVRCPAPVLSSF